MKQTNILKVQRLATKYKVGKVYPSTRKDKKYMVYDPNGDKVHFGQIGYSDFTGHQDKERRKLFRIRNAEWAHAPKWTPAWLSYHLLW
jgi:hypothetical protein